MTELRYLRKYFYKYRYYLILGIFITIIARIFSLVMPEYVQNSITAIEQYATLPEKEGNQIKQILLQYVLIIIGATLLSALFTFFMRQLIINVSRYIEYDLKNEIFVKYQQLSLNFYKRNRTGDLMNRISEDVSKVRMYVGPAIMYSVQTITLFVCVVPLMFYTSAKLTLYTLIPLPILSILIYIVSKKIHRQTLVVQQYLSQLSTFSQETFSGISVIKAYADEARVNAQLADLAESGRQKSIKLAKIQAIFFPTMILMIGLSLIFVVFIGGKLYYQGEIESIGVIVKFSIYVMMLTWPVATVGWVSSIVQQAEASQKRINEFLAEVPEIQNAPNAHKINIQGDIRFENVSFTYPDTGIEALKNVSFTLKKGQNIAIIGKTGSGKSTILDLITRTFDATSGEIFIDGYSIKQLDLKQLREAISVVPQESFLFSDSIRNNLLFGNAQATEAQMIAMSQNAVVHQNILEFPKQYDTILGERGVSLSGGQKQRLCIARALLKPAQVYLFDDSLSAVDTDTEEKILHNLDTVIQGKTRIIVSHRISATQNADLIIMLEAGKVSAMGSHQELYQNSRVYRAFYEAQRPK
ncbi:putative multidrug resistance ABC transporter ATP-binding/permease protein yheI [Capnocytophaga canimorsus]|uniref:Putative multidrug resistance ABC transporter ATP-binding/permease protein yheI n=1 Tax=Capnocytophaga canimorsus TaxID=28188 RepID=A0A0B7HIK1_9FLAO|nr:ABC transporter ATP-binding protein [Capnocytophaga canimorsus]ATA77798.1 ABC transporter ATP-binding protein [Capnocytophaga canimorsus]PJI79690.1 ATP-binding cassette subfamily B protein [Capnocytophaga canimorsus]CEN39566.1 putative multidrug resistance ABC transporter ATP-binding/permease protein yheI [Capnocytophaga canimorsus]STA73089.1 Probable multidrug resistance ABC transporter ATP-binding/permease protein YheI [Capnocytophaga canimorsus]